MGLSLFSSSSFDDFHPGRDMSETKPLPNPQPDRYKIIRYLCDEVKRKLLVEIQYLDCTNYEGRKILYYDNCTMFMLLEQKLVDPHFSDTKAYFSPVARFEPTEKGWNMGIFLMQS